MKTPRLIAVVIMSVTAAFHANPAACAEPCPLMTATQCLSAPVIDGRLSEGEWDSASAISGFRVHSTGYLAPENTKLYVTYDDEKLYIGFKCCQPTYPKAAKIARDESVWEDDAVEVFIQPSKTDGAYYQIVANSKGVFWDGKQMDSAWNGNIKYFASISPSYGTINPDLDSLFWEGELSIRISDLGLDKPEDGHIMGFAVARDHQSTTPAFASTWSTFGFSFHDSKCFGTLILDKSSPAVQMLASADINELKATGYFEVYNPSDHDSEVSGSVRFLLGEREVKRLPFSAIVAPGCRKTLDGTAMLAPGDYTLESALSCGGKLLSKQSITVNLTDPIKVHIDTKTKTAIVEINIQGMPQVDGSRLMITLQRGTQDLTGRTLTLSHSKDHLSVPLDLKDLPGGKYSVSVSIFSGWSLIKSSENTFTL